MGAFWKCFVDFFYPINSAYPLATQRTGTRPDDQPALGVNRRSPGSEGAPGQVQPRRRPDVTGPFTVTLICGIESGYLLVIDLIREGIRIGQIPAFAAVHPMSYILLCCVALLAILRAVGDV